MVRDYIRQHHLGLVAIFIALTGTAYASNQIADQQSNPKAVSAKVKRGPRGPQGPAGPQGPQGLQGNQGVPGQDGSPDTADQVLTKLLTVDGAGSGLDADKLDNLDSTDIGLGFFTGRLNNLATQGTVTGAPSGVSAALTTTTLNDQNMTLSPNRTIVLRSLSATLTEPVGCTGICGGAELATVRIEAFAPSATSPTTSISCTIVPLNSACTAAGPSATVPANSSLRVSVTVQADSQVTATTDLLFSWKAAAS